jgi:hypothetical protein
MDSATIDVIVAVRADAVNRFAEGLKVDPALQVTMCSTLDAARTYLNAPDNRSDVFVVDNNFEHVFELVKALRQSHPSLLIITVDEDADFGMPGRADDVTTNPFENNELIRKIKRVSEERRLETLRADALPPVRNFAKELRKATKGTGKQQAAVVAIQQLGYDYVGFYSIMPSDPPSLSLGAQVGPNNVMSMMQPRLDYSGALGWVAKEWQPKILIRGQEPSHFLVERGKYGSAVIVPVGTTLRFGVIIACREAADAIKQDSALMIELICAQLASALAKDLKS